MKQFKIIGSFVMLALSASIFNSCLNDDGYSLDDHWWEIATARPLDGNSFYFTTDDGETLWPAAPVGILFHPDRPQRVAIDYTILGDDFQGYDRAIRLNLLDTVLTKGLAEPSAKADSIYGTDPVKISAIWIGDGFLNVSFRAKFSGSFRHSVNLVQDLTASDSPLHLNFHHNAFEDKGGSMRSGLVAFDLSSLDTDGKEVNMKVDVNTFDGIKTYDLKYNSSGSDSISSVQPKLNEEFRSISSLD